MVSLSPKSMMVTSMNAQGKAFSPMEVKERLTQEIDG